MKKRIMGIVMILTIIPSLSACQGGDISNSNIQDTVEMSRSSETSEDATLEERNLLSATEEIVKLEQGLSLTRYTDDYMFDTFLTNGGAGSDRDVLKFLMDNMLVSDGISFAMPGFGCSTISVPSGNGEGYYIHPLAIEGFCVDGLLDYQFIREGSQKLIMLAQTLDKDNQGAIRTKMKELMGKILREKHLQNIDFKISFTNEIKPDLSTGKKRLVVTNSRDIAG